MIHQKISDFRFEEETHSYFLGSTQLPSVTQLLKPIVSFDGIPVNVLEYKARLGTAVHKACEFLDAGILDFDSLSEVLIPYVNAWMLFKEQTGFMVLLNEEKYYHPKHFYAGQIDRVGMLNGKKVLIDLKTSAFLSPWIGVQLAGYSLLLESSVNERLPRYAVQLKKDGRYVLEPYEDGADYSAFLSLLNLYNWQKRNNYFSN